VPVLFVGADDEKERQRCGRRLLGAAKYPRLPVLSCYLNEEG
jgi:hypothetical protein